MTNYYASGDPAITNATNGDTYHNQLTGEEYTFTNNTWILTVPNTSAVPANYYTISGGTITGSPTIATTGYVSMGVGSSISEDVEVTQLDKKRFSIKNITVDNREVYLWLLNTAHTYKIINQNYSTFSKDMEIEFDENAGAVEFKLSWVGM